MADSGGALNTRLTALPAVVLDCIVSLLEPLPTALRLRSTCIALKEAVDGAGASNQAQARRLPPRKAPPHAGLPLPSRPELALDAFKFSRLALDRSIIPRAVHRFPSRSISLQHFVPTGSKASAKPLVDPSEPGWEAAAHNLTSLEVVNCGRVGEEGLRRFLQRARPRLRHLKLLGADGCKRALSALTETGAPSYPVASRLETFHFQQCAGAHLPSALEVVHSCGGTLRSLRVSATRESTAAYGFMQVPLSAPPLMPGVMACTRLVDLQLHAVFQHLSGVVEGVLGALPELESLHITPHATGGPSQGRVVLPSHAKLCSLRIGYPVCVVAAPGAQLPRLRDLNVAESHSTLEGSDQCLAPTSVSPALETLNVSSTPVPLEALAVAVAQCPALQTLTAAGCRGLPRLLRRQNLNLLAALRGGATAHSTEAQLQAYMGAAEVVPPAARRARPRKPPRRATRGKKRSRQAAALEAAHRAARGDALHYDEDDDSDYRE